MHAMEIARTGLEVEWRRMEVIAENLANAQTLRTADGQVYRAREVVSGPKGDFAAYLDGSDGASAGLSGVTVYGIEASNIAPRLVHEPGNPQADANGDVTYPGIDQASEMTRLVKTTRAYEADMVAMNAARQMYSKALELGGRK
jgi:flagellar basal-body rod protein FlgC